MPRDDTLRVAAPAKINLYLRVTGRRPDGYHLLDSLVAFAGIHDTLVLAPAETLTLEIEGPFATGLSGGGTSENLVLAAARRLAEATGVTVGAHMTLIKRLPVASGIGGGSADAAAALRGLSTLWEVGPAASDLHRVAIGLGADVPVCLAGRAAFLSGIGETLRSAGNLPTAGMLLVNPRVPVSTSEVFRRCTAAFSPPADLTPEQLTGAGNTKALARLLAPLGNDLAAPAIETAPVISDVLARLEEVDGCRLARVSGSGGTCFGLFDDPGAAERAAIAIRAIRPDWWVAATELVDDAGGVEPIA